MEYYFDQSYTVKNCNVPNCQGQHFIKFKNGKAVIPTWEMSEIEKCYEQNIKNLCGESCKNKNLCLLHRKLNVFKFFINGIEERNFRNIKVSKIVIYDNCSHPFCFGGWCFEIYEPICGCNCFLKS